MGKVLEMHILCPLPSPSASASLHNLYFHELSGDSDVHLSLSATDLSLGGTGERGGPHSPGSEHASGVWEGARGALLVSLEKLRRPAAA